MLWNYTHIISIGCRLCEVRFAACHALAAIDLAEDIYYNTRSSFGPLHATTIVVSNLLSKSYTNTSKHANALDLHSDFIRRTLDSDEYEQKVLTDTTWEQARGTLNSLAVDRRRGTSIDMTIWRTWSMSSRQPIKNTVVMIGGMIWEILRNGEGVKMSCQLRRNMDTTRSRWIGGSLILDL